MGLGRDSHGTPVPEQGRPWVARNNLHEDDHRQTTTRHRPVSRQTSVQETSADTHLETFTKVEKVGEVGKLVERIEIGGPQARKMMKKVETGDEKVRELVKRIQMNDSKVGQVRKSVRVGHQEYTNLEQDAMLAGAGEEDEYIKCFGDVTGKELSWQPLNQAREQELKYLRDLGVYEKVDEREAIAQYQVTPVDTKWVDTDKAFGRADANPFTNCCQRVQKRGQARLVCGNSPPLKALKAIESH